MGRGRVYKIRGGRCKRLRDDCRKVSLYLYINKNIPREIFPNRNRKKKNNNNKRREKERQNCTLLWRSFEPLHWPVNSLCVQRGRRESRRERENGGLRGH